MDTTLTITRIKSGEGYEIPVLVEIDGDNATMHVTKDVPKTDDGDVVPGEFIYRKGGEIMPLSEEIDEALSDMEQEAKDDRGREDFEDAVEHGEIARPSWY